MTIPRLPELLIILFIVFLIFGAGKLPQVASALGRSIKEFRKNTDMDDDAAGQPSAEPKPGAATTDKS